MMNKRETFYHNLQTWVKTVFRVAAHLMTHISYIPLLSALDRYLTSFPCIPAPPADAAGVGSLSRLQGQPRSDATLSQRGGGRRPGLLRAPAEPPRHRLLPG